MAGTRSVSIELSDRQRDLLERLGRSSEASQQLMQRCCTVLLSAAGWLNEAHRTRPLIARLAALVPRPKAHWVRYHALFAPNARERAGIVARPKVTKASATDESAPQACTTPMSWMARLKRCLRLI